MKYTLSCVLLLLAESTFALECDTEGEVRCKSCAESVLCWDGHFGSFESCNIANQETCLETHDSAVCIAAQSDCFCNGRKGCVDDPYSRNHFMDCSSDDPEQIYKSCEGELEHDGRCGCVEPGTRTDFKERKKPKPVGPPQIQRDACDADCIYNTTDESCATGEYFPCGSSMIFTCPTQKPCFSLTTCTCVENTTECTGTCDLFEVPQPDGCSMFALCNEEDPNTLPCVDPLCFDPITCTCDLPPTTTTTTTLYPCPEGCDMIEHPQPDGCSDFAPCSAPGFITSCDEGSCWDQEACSCSALTSVAGGTTSGGGSGGTTSGGGSGGTTSGGGSGGTTSGGGSGGTTSGGGSGGTTSGGGSGGTTSGGGSGGTTSDGGSGGTTSDGGSGGTTLPECPECGFIPDGGCDYIRCSDNDPGNCPDEYCFDAESCLCEPL